jgi:hypothetical protein
MTALVFAAPYVPPLPPEPLFQGYRMIWRGADGSQWNLTDPDGGVVMLADVVGLHLPGYDRLTSTSPARAGSRHRGSRAQERRIEWPLLVWSDDDSAAWRERDRAFWSSLDVDRPGTWVVQAPKGGQTFEIECRLVSDGGFAFSQDPSKAGWALYQVELVANDPYWLGAEISSSWANRAADPFFGSDGALHIASSATLVDATMSNPGEVSAWVSWTLEGPFTTPVSITVDGGTIKTPTIAAGSVLEINTDPGIATAYLDGVDVSGLVDPWDPRPLPPGQDVPVAITAEGFGSISARFRPKYRRGV